MPASLSSANLSKLASLIRDAHGKPSKSDVMALGFSSEYFLKLTQLIDEIGFEHVTEVLENAAAGRMYWLDPCKGTRN